MSRVKPGDILSCEVCGLAVIVDEECGCVMAELICCDEPMENKGTKPPRKVAPVKKASPAANKPAAKKAVVTKATAKKPAAKKPAAKKPAAKKK